MKLSHFVRNFSVPLLVLTSALASAQRVTISSLGERLETFVPKLAAASGTNLAVDRSAWNEVIFVSVKDVPLEDLKARIAKATGLEWVEAQGVTWLAPTDRTNRIARQEFVALTTDWLAKARDLNDLVKLSDGGAVDQLTGPPATGPGRGARLEAFMLASILKHIDMAALAQVDIGGRVVFSTNRTLTQVPFPASAANWAARAVSDKMASWRKERAALGQSADESAKFRIQGYDHLLKVGIKKAIMVVRRENVAHFSIQFSLLDSVGNEVGASATALSFSSVAKSVGMPEVALYEHPNPDYLAAIAGVDSERDAGRPSLVRGQGNSGTPIDTASLTDCVNSDPFAVVAGPWLAQLAKTRSVVAVMPDAALPSLAKAIRAKGNLWDAIINCCQIDVTANSIDISPKSHLFAWKSRINRAAFATMLQSVEASYGMLSLDQLSQYIAAQPAWSEPGTWDAFCMRNLWGSQVEEQVTDGHYAGRDALAVYAASRRKQGDEKSVADIASAFLNKASLGYIVFNRADGPMAIKVGKDADSGDNVMLLSRYVVTADSIRFNGSRMDGSFLLAHGTGQDALQARFQTAERTELLPNGLQGEGKIQSILNSVQELVLVDGKAGQVECMSIDDYAMILAKAHFPGTEEQIDPAKFAKFGLADREEYAFLYWPSTETVLNGAVSGFKLLTAPGAYNALPDAVRQQITKAEAKFRQQLARGGG